VTGTEPAAGPAQKNRPRHVLWGTKNLHGGGRQPRPPRLLLAERPLEGPSGAFVPRQTLDNSLRLDRLAPRKLVLPGPRVLWVPADWGGTFFVFFLEVPFRYRWPTDNGRAAASPRHQPHNVLFFRRHLRRSPFPLCSLVVPDRKGVWSSVHLSRTTTSRPKGPGCKSPTATRNHDPPAFFFYLWLFGAIKVLVPSFSIFRLPPSRLSPETLSLLNV